MDAGLNSRPDRSRTGGDSTLPELLVVFVVLVSLGFPGSYLDVLPGVVSPLMEYGSFFTQIVLMLLLSGNSVMDIKLIHLKRKYTVIYLMLAEFFLVSMLVTDYPREQLISCVRFTVTGLFALAMLDHYEEKKMIELTCYAQAVFIALTLLFLLLCPGRSFSYEDGGRASFSGLFERKNNCAAELCFGIIVQYVLYKLKRNRGEGVSLLFWLFFFVQALLLAACRSIGAFFSGAMALLYVWIWERVLRDRSRPQLGILYVVVSIGFLVFALTLLPLFAPLLEAVGKDATLSNRTTMWAEHIELMQETHTMTGFGLFMFWRDPEAVALIHNRFNRGTWFASMTTGAHNTILELWLNVGLLGVAAYFLALVYAFRDGRRLTRDQYTVCGAILVLFLVKGLIERSYTTSNYQTVYLFILLGIGCSGAEEPETGRKSG